MLPRKAVLGVTCLYSCISVHAEYFLKQQEALSSQDMQINST